MFSLRRLVEELGAAGHLVSIDDEIGADLEAAEIQRRVFASGGPAVFYRNVAGCKFPLVSNLFGTLERARYLFRDTYDAVRRAIELKIDPTAALRRPLRYWRAPLTAWQMRPKRVSRGAVLAHEIRLSELPQIKSWPLDGGPFITLPQVYTEDVSQPGSGKSGFGKSNLGMYRVQVAGDSYETDREVGLHYQIHRGIGVHHAAAIAAGKPLRVNIFVGGHPAMTLAAVMPLPEGMSELTFAGALAGGRIPMVVRGDALPIYADADFCITGTVIPDKQLPEGPFGDHLGYYSLAHNFPVLRVERVYHRHDAVWPFTVVGRPPQEDTTFGQLIHELTGPLIPTVLPGVKEVHAVDAAGVHPLLLAIGSERYMPFHANPRPQELLTQASAILGQGQMSLAKYLLIANRFDDERLDLREIGAFFRHLLSRVDWQRDLHFHTCTTIDTLDYSGDGFNMGSKVVIAAVGSPIRELATEVSSDLLLPEGHIEPRVPLPGILVVQVTGPGTDPGRAFDRVWPGNSRNRKDEFALIVLVDDSEFTARSLNNFLWVTFTRSNPAKDIYGVGEFTRDKHWGCRGPLIIDARIKPHHAPPLVEDPQITRKVDALAARGGPLARWL
ncbi:MAG: UbiD family decarboxylase [Planctomycetaceae bacterium]|nr:UbiD family decarboxylase [Planctomycetaceae bacterium]